MNVSVRLVVMAGAALVAAALLAAGIYYLAAPSRSSGPALPAHPEPVEGRPSPSLDGPDPAEGPASVVPVPPTRRSREGGNPDGDQYVSPPDAQREATLPPSQDAEPTAVAAPPTAGPTPSPTLILSPSKDTPSVAAAQVAISIGGKLQAPDSAPQTPGSGSDDQVQFTPEKPAQQYPNLSTHLNRLATAGETGQTTAQQSDQFAAIQQDDPVAVTVHLSANVDDVVTFLEANGGDPRNVGEDYIEAYVPIPLLGSLSQQPGVLRVREIVPPQGASQPATGNPGRP